MSDEHAPNAQRAATWRRYLRFWGPRAEADVDDELRFHIEMRVREYVARGLSESEARAATARRLGALAANRAECLSITTRRERRMTRAQLVDAFTQDIRFAIRTLGREKGWTAVAILTLALGIGANTAVFSVVSSLLLHPLSYPYADRVALVYQEPTQGNISGMMVTITPSLRVVRAWRETAHSFEDLEAYSSTSMTLLPSRAEAISVRASSILPSFLTFTGEHALIGRGFTNDDVKNGGHVALVSESMWRSRYGGDRSIIGQTLSLDGSLYTIIGVMPSSVSLPRFYAGGTDIWLPLDLHKEGAGLATIGRLRPGVSYAAAQRELDSVTTRLDQAEKNKMRFRSKLLPPRQMVGFAESLILLSSAVALVLLIACANVAHLLLARAASRQRELAIRAALGAGTGRLARQLLTETFVLASAGCIGGLLVGWLGLEVVLALRPDTLPELDKASIDGTTLLVTLGLALLTGLLFGVVAAVQSARHSTHEALKAGTLTSSHSRRQGRLRGLLVVSEIALSTTLLVGASLLVRSVIRLQSTDAGFDTHGLYGVKVVLPEKAYSTPAARRAFFAEFATRARAIGGVESVMLAEGAPPSMSFLIGALQVEGEPAPAMGTTSFVNYNGVQPNYFRAMGIRLIQGATFSDTTDKSDEVIINEGFARKYFRGRSPLGQRLRVVFNGNGDWMTIVGVVSNAFTSGLTMDAADPLLYVPFQGRYQPAIIVRVKPGANPIPSVRKLAGSIDRQLPPPDVTNVEDAMNQSIATPRFTMLLLASFTILALVLAAVGLYGVLAYAVAQRTREIGIRIALGATRGTIGRTVMSQGASLAVSGIIVGMAGAFWATKFIDGMLYGVPRNDPYSFVAGALLLLFTALLACLVPMRRAVAVDPLIAMRAE